MARVNGTVKFFNHSRGFGFIQPEDGGKDVFVHASALERSGVPALNEGDKVSFEIEDDRRGRGNDPDELGPEAHSEVGGRVLDHDGDRHAGRYANEVVDERLRAEHAAERGGKHDTTGARTLRVGRQLDRRADARRSGSDEDGHGAGSLVGGASLKADDFVAIIEGTAAAAAARR